MGLIFHDTYRWPEKISTHRVSDLAGHAFVQHSLRWPYTGKTRTEALDEMRENEAMLMAPAIVTIETNGGKWDHFETGGRDIITRRRLVHQQRMSMSPSLLEALERMRGTFFTTGPGRSSVSVFAQHLLYDGDREMSGDPESVVVIKASPDCDFDKAFGHACTEAQLERIAKAETDGRKRMFY